MSYELATFGSGCFWCTEAIFQRLPGVEKVVSGYSGGKIKNPTYREVCSGLTGHAEVVQITYNPEMISYDDLVEAFFSTHDPTTLNRQGGDSGTQYRSVIFYHDENQKKSAEGFKKQLDSSEVFKNLIVTEIVPYADFYPAEEYHQNYFNRNTEAPYCHYVIAPKLQKLMKRTESEKLKSK